MLPYAAQVSINCVDGMLEGIEGSDPHRLLTFLHERDHEGSSVTMVVRDTPDSGYRHVDDPERVYKELELWKVEAELRQ